MARRSSTAAQHASQRSAGRSASRRTSTGSRDVVRQIGRPTALTDRVEEALLGYFMEGMPNDTACALAGINPSTFYRWMQRGEDARETLDHTGSLPDTEERFRDFREAVLDAQAQARAMAVRTIFKAMHGGFVTSEKPVFDIGGEVLRNEKGEIVYERTQTPPDARIAMQYLQRADAKNWSQQAANVNAKVEVSGPGGGPVEVEHTVEQVVNLSERLVQVREQFEIERRENEAEAGDDGAYSITSMDDEG